MTGGPVKSQGRAYPMSPPRYERFPLRLIALASAAFFLGAALWVTLGADLFSPSQADVTHKHSPLTDQGTK